MAMVCVKFLTACERFHHYFLIPLFVSYRLLCTYSSCCKSMWNDWILIYLYPYSYQTGFCVYYSSSSELTKMIFFMENSHIEWRIIILNWPKVWTAFYCWNCYRVPIWQTSVLPNLSLITVNCTWPALPLGL